MVCLSLPGAAGRRRAEGGGAEMQAWRGEGQTWSRGGPVGLTVILWTGHFTLVTQFPLLSRGLLQPALSAWSGVGGRKPPGEGRWAVEDGGGTSGWGAG